MQRTYLYHPKHGAKIFDLDEIDQEELAADGWEDVPFDHPSRKAPKGKDPSSDPDDENPEVTKESLEAYALEKYGVNLDKRKGLQKLIAEVEALDSGDGA